MQILGKAGNNYFKVVDVKGKVHAIALFDQQDDASRDEALGLARKAFALIDPVISCIIAAWRPLAIDLLGVTRHDCN